MRKNKSSVKHIVSAFMAVALLVGTMYYPTSMKQVNASDDNLARKQGVSTRVDFAEPVSTISNPANGSSGAANATDGNINNFAAWNDAYERLADDVRPSVYWEIDLGQMYELSKVKMWRYYDDGRSYQNTMIIASGDSTFDADDTIIHSTVSEAKYAYGFNVDLEHPENTYAETEAGKEFLVPVGTNARYIRVYMRGSIKAGGETHNGNHLVEFEVYGSEATYSLPIIGNYSQNNWGTGSYNNVGENWWTVTATGQHDGYGEDCNLNPTHYDAPAGAMFDGEETTQWKWDNSTNPEKSFVVDMKAVKTIDGIRALPRYHGASGAITGYEVYVSTDGSSYIKVCEGTWDINGATDSKAWDDVRFGACEARYVKLVVTSTNGNGNPTLAEFRVTSSYENGNPEKPLRALVTDFRGGGLRKSHATVDADGNITEETVYADGNKTSIRFGYKMYETFNGYELTGWKWNWGTDRTILNKEVIGSNKLPMENEAGVVTSNLVIQNVPVANYKTPIYTNLILTYTNEQTSEVLTIDTGIQERTVYQVAERTIDKEVDAEYGTKIISAYTTYLGSINQ